MRLLLTASGPRSPAHSHKGIICQLLPRQHTLSGDGVRRLRGCSGPADSSVLGVLTQYYYSARRCQHRPDQKRGSNRAERAPQAPGQTRASAVIGVPVSQFLKHHNNGGCTRTRP